MTKSEFTERFFRLRPAIRVDGKDLYVGKGGQIHAVVMDLMPDSVWGRGADIENGWVDRRGNFLDRDQAELVVAKVMKDYKVGGFGGHSGFVKHKGEERHLRAVKSALKRGLPVPAHIRAEHKLNPRKGRA